MRGRRALSALMKEGKAWKGPFVISNYTTDGEKLFEGPGEMFATRIEMEPLP